MSSPRPGLYKPGPRDRYSSPAKGTIRRRAINLLLRKQGITADEAEDHGFRMNQTLTRLRDDGGWDIRVVGYAPTGKNGRQKSIYRIVGRDLWKGGTRNLLEAHRWMRKSTSEN